MKLGYFSTELPNVGDDLNVYLWQKLMPEMNNMGGENCVFIGIGSILDTRFDDYDKKVVFGSGSRGLSSLPEFDGSWDIRFVRGPLSVQVLAAKGIVARFITDPAALVAKWYGLSGDASENCEIGLIPYYKADHDAWQQVAEKVGFKFISPRQSVEAFIANILTCKFVVTEAMHGAIFADALRVPWIAYTSITKSHESSAHSFKWNDWCKSMGIEFSETEVAQIWSCGKNASLLKKIRFKLKLMFIVKQIKKIAYSGRRNLSDPKVLKEKIIELDNAIAQLKADYLSGS